MHCHLSLQNRPPHPRATVTGFLVKQLQTSLASPCLRWLKTKSSSCWKNLTHILCRDPHKNKRCSLLDFKARICLKGYFSAETTAAERQSAWDRSSKGWWEWEIWGRRKGSCWVSKERRLWLLSTTTALHMWLKEKHLRDHGKPSSQRPQRTQADFRDRAGKKIIQSRLGYFPWIIAEPKCWKQVCMPFKHLGGSAGQGENSLVLCS